MNGPRRQRGQDWYTLSVDSLRAVGVFGLLVALAAAAIFGYRSWESQLLQREASRTIDEVQVLIQQVKNQEGINNFRDEYSNARESFKKAREALHDGRYSTAVRSGTSSRNVLQFILDALSSRALEGEAQFIYIQGGVEYRRGELGDWAPARNRLTVGHGDYVRTEADGAAEIMFGNGTLYTVGPDTLFFVSRYGPGLQGSGEQSIDMEYGWVNLNTSKRASNVQIPRARARVQRESRAQIAYDRSSGDARFVAYSGAVDVASGSGDERQLGPLQQVVRRQDRLSSARQIPDQPEGVFPPDNYQIDFDRAQTVDLSWNPVSGTGRYALQIARNRLFVDNLIESSDRLQPSASLGLRGEGTFLWRVAAYDSDGVLGPWSEPRKFRVSSFQGDREGDDAPPPLDILDVQDYGSIFIVSGTTEAGAEVEINGEQVQVTAEGAFTKTVQFAESGWKIVTVTSRDAWGNESVRRRRVLVQDY